MCVVQSLDASINDPKAGNQDCGSVSVHAYVNNCAKGGRLKRLSPQKS